MKITKLCNEYADQNSTIHINYHTFTKIFEIIKNKNEMKKELECQNVTEKETGDQIVIEKRYSTEKLEKIEKLSTIKNIFIGSKRKNEFEDDCKTKTTKRRKISNDNDEAELKIESIKNEMKLKFKTKQLVLMKDSTTGFKDEDFHVINESDEKWIFHESGQIEKNEMLTELVLSEKEIEMILMIKKYFGN